MLRDNLAGLIEPMRAARELNPLALFTEQKKSSDDRPQDALKIPAPKGRNLTLTENAASPFHAEPRHVRDSIKMVRSFLRSAESRLVTYESDNAEAVTCSVVKTIEDLKQTIAMTEGMVNVLVDAHGLPDELRHISDGLRKDFRELLTGKFDLIAVVAGMKPRLREMSGANIEKLAGETLAEAWQKCEDGHELLSVA